MTRAYYYGEIFWAIWHWMTTKGYIEGDLIYKQVLTRLANLGMIEASGYQRYYKQKVGYK